MAEEMVLDPALVSGSPGTGAVRKENGVTPKGVESRWSSTSSIESDLGKFWHDSTALNTFYTTEDTVNTLDSFDFNDDSLFLGPFNSCSTGLSYPTQDSARHLTEASAAGIESIDFANNFAPTKAVPEFQQSTTLLPFPENDILFPSSSWQLPANSGDMTSLSLKERLNGALTRGDGGRLFVPDDALKSLLSHQSVATELQLHLPAMPADEVQQLTHQIAATDPEGDIPTTGMLRTFAALVVLDQVPKVADFIQEGLSDCALPLIKRGEDGLRRRDAPDIPFRRLGSWSQSEMTAFEQIQWRFLSPVFTNSSREQEEIEFLDLQDQAILPYVESWQNKKQDHYKGGNSEVWKVKIHEAHHNFKNINTTLVPNNPFFAIKKLKSKDDEAFRREVRNLQRLHNAEHPNLLSLLATYKYRGYYHLVFPWADGDLRRLWQSTPNPQAGKDEMRWLASQCASIASALRSVHAGAESWMSGTGPSDKQRMAMNKFGIHGDIKPENIFIFAKGQQKSFSKAPLAMGPPKTASDTSSSGASPSSLSSFEEDRTSRDVSPSSIEDLVIGDFGGGDFFDPSSNPDPLKQLTVTYRPPEYDTKLRPISRSWDVWGLGCTYLEFVTWFLLGPSGLTEFAKRRTTRTAAGKLSDEYFETFIDGTQTGGVGATLKESVLSWINDLYRHRNASPFIRDFLDFITHRMFIVENALLTRASGEEVADHLNQLTRKCFDSDAYCLPGPANIASPWDVASTTATNSSDSSISPDALNFDFTTTPIVPEDPTAWHFSALDDITQSWNTAPIMPSSYSSLSCADLLGPSSWNFTAPAVTWKPKHSSSAAGLGKRKRQIEDVTETLDDNDRQSPRKVSPTGATMIIAASCSPTTTASGSEQLTSPQTVDGCGGSSATSESPAASFSAEAAVVGDSKKLEKRFACPYFKNNPGKFRHKRTCCGPGWPTVHRVKEHLYRCHTIGKHTCSRCLKRCKSAADLLAHQRAAVSCETRTDAFPEGTMLPSQEEVLRVKKRVPPNTTEEQRWNEVYLVLFPETEAGAFPTPFYEDEPAPNQSGNPAEGFETSKPVNTPTEGDQAWFCSPSDYEEYLTRSLSPRAQRELERQVQKEFGFFGDTAQTRRVVDMMQKMQLRLFQQFREERARASREASGGG